MKKFIFLPFVLFFFSLPHFVYAADTLVFDSTDKYLGACQLTNKSEWELVKDVQVTTFQVWYNWNQGETTLPVKVYKDGQPFAEFTATRGNCDPYQQQWCNADFSLNKLLPKGKYTTEIENSRQCLKPGGTGAIRLYENDEKTIKEEPSVKEIATLKPVQETYAPITSCSCKQTTTIIVAAAASAFTSFLVSLFLKKK